MWAACTETLANHCGMRYLVNLREGPASVEDVLARWQTHHEFRSWFTSVLAAVPYTAFRWETPAVTAAMVTRPFEFVLLDSPELDRRPDSRAFAEHYARAVDGMVQFSNLGGDAIMVVPSPVGDQSAYGHLAAFVRHAPESQRHALWQAVATAMTRRLGVKPVWLSTAGAGVSWLHVRLDDRPKYYGFEPYRRQADLGG
jgi:hypothetical protein